MNTVYHLLLKNNGGGGGGVGGGGGGGGGLINFLPLKRGEGLLERKGAYLREGTLIEDLHRLEKMNGKSLSCDAELKYIYRRW